MIEEKVTRGIRLAWGEGIALPAAEEVGNAILAAAVTDAESGRNVLALHPESNSLLRFNLLKAISVATNLLRAVHPIFAGNVDITSILAAIGSLASLQGVKEALPNGCGLLVSLLLPEKKTTVSSLRELYRIASSTDTQLADFDHCVGLLERAGCVKVANDEIRLVEYVLMRWR